MSWAAIITVLIQTFGPILVEWLKKWLESKLKSASTGLAEPGTFVTKAGPLAAIFDSAIHQTGRFAFGRRALLRVLKNIAVARADELANGPVILSPAEWDEVRDAATVADE